MHLQICNSRGTSLKLVKEAMNLIPRETCLDGGNSIGELQSLCFPLLLTLDISQKKMYNIFELQVCTLWHVQPDCKKAIKI